MVHVEDAEDAFIVVRRLHPKHGVELAEGDVPSRITIDAGELDKQLLDLILCKVVVVVVVVVVVGGGIGARVGGKGGEESVGGVVVSSRSCACRLYEQRADGVVHVSSCGSRDNTHVVHVE